MRPDLTIKDARLNGECLAQPLNGPSKGGLRAARPGPSKGHFQRATSGRKHPLAPKPPLKGWHRATFEGVSRGHLANDVVIVSGAWVFRFAKSEWGRVALADEVRVLDYIAEHLPLQVPFPIAREADAIAYQLIRGEPLTRWLFGSLDDAAQQHIADQLSAFLQALHAMPALDGIRVVTPGQRRTFIEQTLTPHLMKYQVGYMRQLFDDALRVNVFDYTPCLVNDDLALYHILVDVNTRQINGIIDFGTAHFGDPACDLGCLIQHFGEGFVSRMLATYPAAQGLLRRARFGALVVELDWVAQGIDRNDSWFLMAHIGNTRDVRFPV